MGHPVDALEDALPVEQGRGQDQIGLGLKIAKDRPLGESGAQRDVCDLGLFDPVGQKTVQRDLRDQTDILFSLLLVRQVRSPPLRFVSFADRSSVLRKTENVNPLTERAGNKNCAAQQSERHSFRPVKKYYFLTVLRYALLLEKRSLPSAAVRMPQTMTMSAQMIVVGVSTLVSPRNTAVKKIAQAA